MSILQRCIQSARFWFAIIGFVSVNALAHHGSVVNPRLYLAENLVELEGEITAVFWRNPHPRYNLRVLNSAGEEETWELELNGSPIGYARMGITADDIVRTGDHVKVAGYISRQDSHSIGLLHVLLPNGKEFVNNRRALRWSSERMTTAVQPIDPARVAAAREAADGLFRVWGSVGGADVYESSYEHLLTEKGRELGAAYDPIADNAELNCRQGMPDTMFDRGSPMEMIDQGDRILIHLQEYDIERIIHMDGQENPAQPQISPQYCCQN